MTANLTLTQNKQLARELKRLLEPLYNSKTSIKNFVSIDYINSKLTGVFFENLEQIQKTLATNYSPKTTNALIELIKQPVTQVVLDCSICNLEPATLQNLFYNNSKRNVVLSPTFDELISLSKKSITNTSDSNTVTSVYNANFLVKSILADTNSTYCTTIMLNSNPKTYVDNILLEYCEQTNSELLTCDYALALRGKLRNIAVTAIHNIASLSKQYHPNQDGRNIFLDKSILTANISLTDLIDLAETHKSNKFIVSNDFVETLEKSKQDNNVKEYIKFFLLDTSNSYSCFKNATLIDVFKETNAIAYVADKRRCLEFRSIGADYYIILDEEISLSNPEPNVSNNFNFISTNSDFDSTLIKKKANKKKTKNPLFPYFENYEVNISKINFNELVWILDKDGNEIKFNKRLSLKPGYSVIHGINTLKDDTFKLNIYTVNSTSTLNFFKEFVFSSKNFSSKVDRGFKFFAEILVLMKKTSA